MSRSNLEPVEDQRGDEIELVVRPALLMAAEVLLKAKARPAIVDHLLSALRELDNGLYDG